MRTVENAFAWIAAHDKPDLILWTGDVNSHNVWQYTKQGNLDAMANLTALFQKYFSGVPIFSAVGNHEEVPCNE